ncbi:cleavage stimulation factor subunit 1-like [Corticium candelabrum]|uniref:cleavage stimulation factor subunit 1-like n=1 Tax=Corticium candelabrum TaxID=121492 RepID=UPI002E258AE6|nr:cleavage stimulation factor subunit 1-like [Corticium candelabrum]
MAAAVKDREALYKLIISQLRYDGYENVASSLVKTVAGSLTTCAPSSRLAHIVSLGQKAEGESGYGNVSSSSLPTPSTSGIDLEFGHDSSLNVPPICDYETISIIPHKGQCTAATFSPDGRLAATGSYDTSIKIIDVERAVAKGSQGAQHDLYPIVRTLYDHMESVTCIEFHPMAPFIASGSDDCTIKFFEFTKPSVKRAFRFIQEVVPVRCMAFHPSGDFLVVGTEQSTIRLYDVNSLQCFVSSNPRDQHTGPITSVKYTPTGKLYATSSKDGSVKLWDGVSNRCVNVFPNSHGTTEVSSVAFSKNSKYLLTCGKDSLANLWEISTGRIINSYKDAMQSHCRSQAVFNHTEDWVIMPDEKTSCVHSWDSRTAEKANPLSSGHSYPIRCIVHSPSLPAFITCSDDHRARFWCNLRSLQ